MTWKRSILADGERKAVAETLQPVLADLVDLALQIKQAHWNVKGPNFRAVHLQLDEVVESVRTASDDVAERIDTLGHPAVGDAAVVQEQSRLEAYPRDFVNAPKTISLIADRLSKTLQGVRDAIEKTDPKDPVTGDLLIGISGDLEKHLWMIQAQEGEA